MTETVDAPMQSPGAARMDASRNEFAKRMMDKPKPASMNSDPAARFFYDPPENIQIAFGGRPWFFKTACQAPHRIGLLLGLGWRLAPTIVAQDERGINGVRITARTVWYGMTEQLYDLFFVRFFQNHAEGEEPDNLEPMQYQTIEHVGPLTAEQLKPEYARVLGEHAV